MDFQDKTLVCKDCGKEFVFSAGEQAFYAEKGFENEPARCHECRDKRRREREGGKEQRQMYTVECAECGIFPASIEVAPYSPSALAKVKTVPDAIPGPAAGTTTFQKILISGIPSVRAA